MPPENRPNPDDDHLKKILEKARTVAVVGLSADAHRASHMVAAYLQKNGYRIMPVNPKAEEILGEKSYPDLASIPEAVDVVDVFRRSEAVPEIAAQAEKIGAKVLWLQLGIRNDQAAEKAQAAGLEVVQDICMKVTHERLMGKGHKA